MVWFGIRERREREREREKKRRKGGNRALIIERQELVETGGGHMGGGVQYSPPQLTLSYTTEPTQDLPNPLPHARPPTP